MTEPNQAGVRSDQDRRRAALIERIGKVVYLCADTPLQGDLGDAAYELLIQASAQIASDRKRLSALTNAGDMVQVPASVVEAFLRNRVGELPSRGWLRDNDEVRQATNDLAKAYLAAADAHFETSAPAAFDGGK